MIVKTFNVIALKSLHNHGNRRDHAMGWPDVPLTWCHKNHVSYTKALS